MKQSIFTIISKTIIIKEKNFSVTIFYICICNFIIECFFSV